MLHKESTFQVFQFAASTRKLLNKRRHNYLQPATKKNSTPAIIDLFIG